MYHSNSKNEWDYAYGSYQVIIYKNTGYEVNKECDKKR